MSATTVQLLFTISVVLLFIHPSSSQTAGNNVTNSDWVHRITVDKDTGTDNHLCIAGDNDYIPPCATVNMALKGLVHDSTLITIRPGTYSLEHGNETVMSHLSRVAIVGESGGHVLIKCSASSAGIQLYNINHLTIDSITLDGCGRDVLLPAYNPYEFKPALLIHTSTNVLLSRLRIMYSDGTPLVVFMTLNVTITDSYISNSRAILPQGRLVDNTVYVRGGGILIWYSVFGASLQQSFINITNTTIIDNELAVREPDNELLRQYVSCLVNAPDMGGITVSWFPSIVMNIDSCTIRNNSRGFHFNSLYDASISVTNSTISSNRNASIIFSPLNSDIDFRDVETSESVSLMLTTAQQSVVKYIPNGYIYSYSNPLNMTLSIEYNEYYTNYSNRITLQNDLKSCFDRDYTTGICSANYNNNAGRCPRYYSKCLVGFECNCTDFHSGRLCGGCQEGYSVAINSPHLSCVQCDSVESVMKGWMILVGLEFVPITLMVVLIGVFNVNLNQGSLNAFVFLCQVLTIQFPSVGYPSWIITETLSYANWDKFIIFLLPFTIWNLDFISILSGQHVNVSANNTNAYFNGIPVCISSSTDPLGAISFWYVIAFYPVFLLTVFYAVLKLYDRGYRPIVCLVRPLHRGLAKIWRAFNISPSLSHTVASVYTLCFTQLAAISMKLFHPTWYTNDMSGDGELVFFYDGSIGYFNILHIVSLLPAFTVLLILISFTVYLALHQFKMCQRCLSRVTIKKDMLISLTDVFTAPFKNGTQNSSDYRYFSCVLFALRLLIMTFYYVPPSTSYLDIIPKLEVTLCVLYICTIVVFKPYKRNIHVYNEMIIFIVLILFSTIYYFPAVSNDTNVYDFYWYKRLVIPIMMALLCLIVAPYCFIWIIKKTRLVYQYMRPHPTATNARINNELQLDQQYLEYSDIVELHLSNGSGDVYADRLENPTRYYNEDNKLRSCSVEKKI